LYNNNKLTELLFCNKLRNTIELRCVTPLYVRYLFELFIVTYIMQYC